MKTATFLAMAFIISLILPCHSSYAQGNTVPGLAGYGYDVYTTSFSMFGNFSSETGLPVTITASHYEPPSGEEIQDTVFTVNTLNFELDIDGLLPGHSYVIHLEFSNQFGDGFPWDESIITNPVGVGEVEDSKLKLYPNPLQNELFVQNADLGTQVTVSNLLGKVILSESIQDATRPERISFEDQPAGVYFVTVTSAGKAISKKVQKK